MKMFDKQNDRINNINKSLWCTMMTLYRNKLISIDVIHKTIEKITHFRNLTNTKQYENIKSKIQG